MSRYCKNHEPVSSMKGPRREDTGSSMSKFDPDKSCKEAARIR